jgi:hypothetical protein
MKPSVVSAQEMMLSSLMRVFRSCSSYVSIHQGANSFQKVLVTIWSQEFLGWSLKIFSAKSSLRYTSKLKMLNAVGKYTIFEIDFSGKLIIYPVVGNLGKFNSNI